jgi:hypothetical protein
VAAPRGSTLHLLAMTSIAAPTRAYEKDGADKTAQAALYRRAGPTLPERCRLWRFDVPFA